MLKYFTLHKGAVKTAESNPGQLLGKASGTFSSIDPDFEKFHLNVKTPSTAKASTCDLLLHVAGEITFKEMHEDLKKAENGRAPEWKSQEQVEAFCSKNKAELNKEGDKKTLFFFEEQQGGDKKTFVATVIMKGNKPEIYVDPLDRSSKFGPWEKTMIAFPQKPPAPPAP